MFLLIEDLSTGVTNTSGNYKLRRQRKVSVAPLFNNYSRYMENRYYMCRLLYQVGKFQEWKLSLSFQAKTIRYLKTFHFIIYSFWFQLNRWGKVTFGSTSMQKDQIRSVSNRNSVSVVIDGISTRNFSSFLEMHRPRSTSLYCHVCGSLFFFISIFSNIYIKYNKRKKESKRTHRFSVTLSFAPKRS